MSGLEARQQVDPDHNAWQRLYHGETRIRIVQRWPLWFALSGLVILIGFAGLFTRGLNMGIDFTGGNVWQVPAGKGTTKQVEDAMAKLGYGDVQVQEVTQSSGNGERLLRVEAEDTAEIPKSTTKALDDVRSRLDRLADKAPKGQVKAVEQVRDDLDQITGPFRTAKPKALEEIDEEVGDLTRSAGKDGKEARAAFRTRIDALGAKVNGLSDAETAERSRLGQDVTDELVRITGSKASQVTVDSVGPSWGQQISNKARTALIVFLAAITLFITIRFEWKMALATVAALFHDLFVVVGIYALLQLPVTPATVVALLTMLGFSIYDGIVVFDRVNENQKLLSKRSSMTYTDMSNLSLNEVLMRSLNTSITTLLPIVSVLVVGSLLLGASTLREFGVALFLGLLSGAYSSLFIATPILALLKEREPRYRELRRQIEQSGHGSVAAEEVSPAPKRERVDDDGNPLPDEERVADDDPVKAAIMAGSTAPPRPRKKGKRR